MTAGVCKRRWEAEAERDGRLEGSLLLAFQRHAEGCRECARERALLARLGRELTEAELAVDEVALRRLRQATLRDAAVAMERADEPGSRRRIGVLTAAVAACALAGIALGAHFMPSRAPLAMHASPGARFHRTKAANVERIELDDGTLNVSVHRTPNDPRVVVRVPEGEIEDVGTTFSVSVRDRRTVRIAVREGVVIFHRAREADLRLAGGFAWSPVRADVVPTAVPATAPVPAAQVPPAPSPNARHTGSNAHHKPSVLQHSASHGANAPPALGPRTEERKLPAFDAGGEDGAYLRVLALLSEGRKEEARLAAVEYLRSFPNGFRRPEIEKLARSGSR